jgi:hypothetical protein
LYASVSADAAIPEMEPLFGANLADTNPKEDITLRVVTSCGDLKVGDTFHYLAPSSGPRSWGSLLTVAGGTVIAVDQDNRPALVSHTLGSGKTMLSAYPLEHYLANQPAVFDKTENTHRIYQAFMDWAGVKPLFRTDQPSVEVAALKGDHRGYAVLVNHGSEARNVTVSTSLPIHSVQRVSSTGFVPLKFEASAWTMEVGPYEGVVIAWRE